MNVINTTSVINVNNLLLNLSNSILQNNGVMNSESNSSQGSFSKMLSMLLGGNISGQTSINDVVSSEDITNLINFSDKEDKSTNKTETDYSSIMNMFFGSYAQNPIFQINTMEIEPNNMNTENSIIELNQNIDNNVNSLNNSGEKSVGGDSKKYSIVDKKTYQELPVIKDTVNYLSNSNNKSTQSSIVSSGNLVSSKNDGNLQENVFNKTTSIIEDLDNTNEMKSDINRIKISEEILPKIWNEKQDDAKTNTEFSNSILENKNLIFNENNKIIEISDQSTKIKDTVLSQLEDKIIFMAKEKEGMQQVTMELNPKNLGKVNVKMSVEPERITVEIMALDQKTSSILMSNVQDLTKALQNHFISGNVNVTVTENVLNQYSQSNMGNNQQHSPREQSHNAQSLKNNVNDVDDSNFITEMINLRNFKLNTVV